MVRPIDPNQHHQPIQSSGPHHIKNDPSKSFNVGSLQQALGYAQDRLKEMFQACTPDGQFKLTAGYCDLFNSYLQKAYDKLKNESQRPVTEVNQRKYEKMLTDLQNSIQDMKDVKQQILNNQDLGWARERAGNVCDRLGEITWKTIPSLR